MRQRLEQSDRALLTVRGYAHDWRLFTRWCEAAGLMALPASSDTLALYATWLLTECSRKVTTAARHCAAILHVHRARGLAAPARPDAVLAAVKRARRERPQGKRALEIDLLARVVSRLDNGTNAGARDRAIILLGFASSLRRSELARLTVADLVFRTEGLAVTIRYSKTDQLARGRVVAVWAGTQLSTDPVKAVRVWLGRRGDAPGPLFRRVSSSDRVLDAGITGETVHDVLRRALGRAGIDPAPYGAHSLRAGSITAAAVLGASDDEIMRLSGHASAAVMRHYIRIARVFAGRNPLAGVL